MDLADVVGRTRDLMLDQFASLEGGDLGGLGADMTHMRYGRRPCPCGYGHADASASFRRARPRAGGDGLDGCRTASLPLLATPVVLVLAILVLAAATLAATTATTATTPASTLLGLAVTALVLCAIAAVLAILVALIAIAAIALWGGAGIADLGGRTAVADLRLGLRESEPPWPALPALAAGVSFWACSSAMCSSFVVDAAAEIMRPPPVRARLRRHSLGRGARRRRW